MLWLVLALALPARAQSTGADLTLTVNAGFEGYFRDDGWLPVFAEIVNNGEDLRGQLVVRPSTSGAGIGNIYSTPLELPTGSQQNVTFYVTAAQFVTQLRVELIDERGVVVSSAIAPVRAIQPQDRLAVLVTNSVTGAVDLTAVRYGAFAGHQAFLTIDEIADRVGLFDSVDLLVFSDVDSGGLSSAQQGMLADWIAAGGHLIVTGGANWRATSGGLLDLLPLTPTAEIEVEQLDALGNWLGGAGEELRVSTLVTTGRLVDGAEVLLRDEAGTPLIVRRTLGSGTVDFLAFDPNGAAVRNWALLPELWYTLASSVDPQPGWSNGFSRWSDAANAVEILPGFNLLPDVLPLLGFLALYIALIGPVNYIVLNRINRREWAWFTIPIFIGIFTLLAYFIGTNLRGNEATLSRLTVVRGWYDSAGARAESIIGLLSPRRAAYDLEIPDAVLRVLPLPQFVPTGILTTNAPVQAEIGQSAQFVARGFTVDASFLADFVASGVIDAPGISGRVTFSADPAVGGQQRLRGAVRNESAFTLEEAVILARGVSYRLEEPLAPGDVVDFELTLTGESFPAPVLYSSPEFSSFNPQWGFNFGFEQTLVDVLGEARYNQNIAYTFINDDVEALESRRRQWFLSSFVRDVFATTSRGNGVYLVGWSANSPMDANLIGANWRPFDTTVYIQELETRFAPVNGEVRIGLDQFSWSVRSFTGLREIAPVEFRLDQGESVVFRFTPLASARLSVVEGLDLIVLNNSSGARSLPMSLWDWERGEWVEVETRGEKHSVNDFEPFIGPLNTVQIRLTADDLGGFMRIGQLAVEQTGRFEN
jgi:hypothetical protein